MDKIRVLFANHPVMVSDAIRQLVVEQDDMEVVGDCRGPMKILQETGRTKADVVILAQEGSEEPALCEQLLSVYPDLTILGLTQNLNAAYTQQLRSQRQRVATDKHVTIVQTLRMAVRQSGSEK
ncbi:MAG: response regulator transcription factor [Nitrospira sp.]|nr:response regulator transcription factor [Nitrospira sp.]